MFAPALRHLAKVLGTIAAGDVGKTMIVRELPYRLGVAFALPV